MLFRSEMLAVILLGATMLWSLRVQSGGASSATTRRYLRELKRLMLYGVIRPDEHADVAEAARAPRVRTGSPTRRVPRTRPETSGRSGGPRRTR